MIMTDYTEFDAMLLDAIKSGAAVTVAELATDRRLVELAESLSLKDHLGCLVPPSRIFDRRLQALRRAWKIRYSRGKWEVVER
jgi:hypothetical protein